MKYSFVLFFMIQNLVLFGQHQFAVESNGNTTIFSNFDAALTASVDGDIIYLPGGSFTPSGGLINISKRLHIVGAGHYPDSTSATGQTIINGGIRILSGADNGTLEGIYIQGDVAFGIAAENQVIDGYSIKRCFVNNTVELGHIFYTDNSATQNLFFYENIFNSPINFCFIKNSVFSKNIFRQNLYNLNGQVTFRNNIMLSGVDISVPFSNIQACHFYDNIIITTMGLSSPPFSSNVFYNNLFSTNIVFPIGTNQGYNNIINQPIDDIFISHTGSTFNYNNNYNLKPTSPGKNMGSDGTDIGIYGTLFPYKEGAVPFNPHIQYKSIAPQTDSQGNLNVNIRVRAQSN